jgi:hypothetical protein
VLAWRGIDQPQCGTNRARRRAIEDELLERWLSAVTELGADGALRDVAEAFALSVAP